jgi:polyisoprenoid-binding protein YceI
MPISKSVVARLATAIATAALPFAVVAAPEHYVIDPYHSFPHFEVDHLG